MSPLSQAAFSRNETVTRPTTTASLQLRPTIIASSTGRLSGYNGSFTNASSTLPYQTGFSTRIISATPSAAFTTPLPYTNYSSLAVIIPPSTHTVSFLYTTKTLETSISSPTSDLTLTADSPIPTLEQTHGMSLETKVGLALIPLAAGLCIWGLVLFCLWRRRRIHESHHKLESLQMPLPEKSHWQALPLLSDNIKGGRIFTVTAFHGSNNWESEAQMIGPGSREDFHQGASATPPPVRRAPSGRIGEDWNHCSPIREETPSQLRHSDMTRRSLGAEISDLWPSPPPTAWARRQDLLNQLPLSRFGRDMTRPRSPRSPLFSSRKSQRDMRDITRPSVAEHWPLL